jgi:hypothetical protein
VARDRRQTFRDDLEVAEIATLGVCANLDFDQPLVAAALQPVARAAWELAGGEGDAEILRREVAVAEARLRDACFAQMERRFLRRVERYLDDRDG